MPVDRTEPGANSELSRWETELTSPLSSWIVVPRHPGPGMVHRGSFSRRRFIAVGAMGGLVTLPELLDAGSGAGRGRSCIFIVQQGGPSHIDTWDMKPEAPGEHG